MDVDLVRPQVGRSPQKFVFRRFDETATLVRDEEVWVSYGLALGIQDGPYAHREHVQAGVGVDGRKRHQRALAWH